MTHLHPDITCTLPARQSGTELSRLSSESSDCGCRRTRWPLPINHCPTGALRDSALECLKLPGLTLTPTRHYRPNVPYSRLSSSTLAVDRCSIWTHRGGMLPAEGLLWLIVKLKGLNSSPWHFVYEVCAQLLPLALLFSIAFQSC